MRERTDKIAIISVTVCSDDGLTAEAESALEDLEGMIDDALKAFRKRFTFMSAFREND